MRRMNAEQTRAFLLAGSRTAQVATVRADGRPHVVPVWFALDGDDVIFTAGHDTVKARNIARDGRVSLCVEDPTPPFAYVMIEGHTHRRALYGRRPGGSLRQAQCRPR
ncbi:MAG TPA: PPOX class F420-dependent oxidoreductase [Ktedonobacterales bacterium]|nr:PPOX class F420-dependent oxidoreductase [Ktedonobacterales bacterium]